MLDWEGNPDPLRRTTVNKAFVKEEDAWEEPEAPVDPLADLPPGSRNYLTPTGAAALRSELETLAQAKRPPLVAELNARNQGSLGGTDPRTREVRRELRRMERRIQWLTGRLAVTEEIDPRGQKGPAIRFGARVTVLQADGQEQTYTIVGIDETRIEEGRISWASPLARAFLNAEEGELVKVRTPAGEEVLEIVAVTYPP